MRREKTSVSQEDYLKAIWEIVQEEQIPISARLAEDLAVTPPAVTAALRKIGVTDEELPPVVALLLMTGVTQVLALEDALGVTAGHETTRSFMARTIARVDPTSPQT